MRTKQIFKATLAGAVALLAACNGDSTGNGSGAGSLSFGYSGARNGTYSASGKFEQRDTTFVKQPFAVGVRGRGTGTQFLALLSYQPVTASTGHMVLIAMPNLSGTGTFNFDNSACPDEDLCPLGLLLFDTNPDLEEDDSQVFTLSSGTLNITSNSGGRLRGTFSGVAETFFADSTITITNGSFDVPVRSESSLAFTRAAARVPAPLLSRRVKP